MSGMNPAGRRTDRNGMQYMGPRLVTARDDRRTEEHVWRCNLCDRGQLPEGETKYNNDFGGRLCISCDKDYKKKPCSECFTVHNGECI